MAPLSLILALSLSLFTFIPSIDDLRTEVTNTSPSQSVEINIAEISPVGDSGGYAVPASACSDPVYICTGSTDGCGWICPSPAPPGSCSVYPTVVAVGQNVTWTATPPTTATGGGLFGLGGDSTANYTYSWTGTENLSGTSASVSKVYSSTGVKTGSVTIRNGNAVVGTYACSNNVTVVAPLTATCSVSPTTANIGQNVTWSAVASGGAGTILGLGTYTYEWQGTDGLAGSTANVNKTYSMPGTKTGQVRVSLNGFTSLWFNCSNSVNINGGTPPIVTLTANPTTVPGVGSSTTLTWNVQNNATSCTASNGWSGSKAYTNGTHQQSGVVVGQDPTTYAISCSNAYGSDSDTAVVDAEDPIIGVIEPCDGNTVIRQGNVEICYEINPLPQCVIRLGDRQIFGPLTQSTGRFTWELNSQGTFILYCGTEVDRTTIRVLPVFQET